MANEFQASHIIYPFINNGFNNLIARNIGLWVLMGKVANTLDN